MPDLIEVTASEIVNDYFVIDAVSEIIKRASIAQTLVANAALQVADLSMKQDLWNKAKTAHFHAREYHVPKPVLWADESYDFDYENDGSITLSFYNDDDSTLIFNATSELTSEINKGFGFVAFDNLAITNVMIMDADENAYKVHAINDTAIKILEDYICCSLSNHKIEYSTSASEMRESAADNASYNANPNAYYGMNSWDYSIKASRVSKETNADFLNNPYTHYGSNA